MLDSNEDKGEMCNMNNKLLDLSSSASWVLVLVLMIILALGCRFGRSKDGMVSGDFSKIAGNLANYDPKDPPPSPGAAALRRLAELEPSVGKLVGDVEAAERAALKTGLAELRAQRGAGNDTEKFSARRVRWGHIHPRRDRNGTCGRER